MVNFKKISPAALITLKEALTYVYWTKNDLRRFVEYTIKNKAIVSTIDWQEMSNSKAPLISFMERTN